MKWGEESPRSTTSRSLRLLGTVGEPINPRRGCGTARHRRRSVPDRRHVVADRDGRDHDHAAARASPPSRARPRPFPGVDADDRRTSRATTSRRARAASSCSREPWPAMLRGIYGDPERFADLLVASSRAATSPATARSATGRLLLAARPGRRRDERVRSPHLHDRGRGALVDHPAWPRRRWSVQRPVKGQALVAFVTLKGGDRGLGREAKELSEHVRRRSARSPSRRHHLHAPSCQRRASGKIMRRLLRDIAEHGSWATPPPWPTRGRRRNPATCERARGRVGASGACASCAHRPGTRRRCAPTRTSHTGSSTRSTTA